MPFISVSMLEGRTAEQKLELIRELTRVMVETCGAKAEGVHISISDFAPDSWGTGGKSQAEIKAGK